MNTVANVKVHLRIRRGNVNIVLSKLLLSIHCLYYIYVRIKQTKGKYNLIKRERRHPRINVQVRVMDLAFFIVMSYRFKV